MCYVKKLLRQPVTHKPFRTLWSLWPWKPVNLQNVWIYTMLLQSITVQLQRCGAGSDRPHPRGTCWLCLTEHAIAVSYLVFSNTSRLKCSLSGDLWLASTDVCKFKTVIAGGKRRFTESNKNCIWQARSVLPLYTFKISESDGNISVLLSAWTFPTASRCSHLSAFLFIHLKFWIWRTL